jgi:hypothetical protein
MVKGLAKLERFAENAPRNRLRHGRTAKYVDASPFVSVKGGYSPVTGEIILARLRCVHHYMPAA